MVTFERIEQLEHAQDMISQAIYLIEDALYGTTHEAHAKAYIVPHLRTWIGEGNPHDTSIPDYIDMLRQEENFEEE